MVTDSSPWGRHFNTRAAHTSCPPLPAPRAPSPGSHTPSPSLHRAYTCLTGGRQNTRVISSFFVIGILPLRQHHCLQAGQDLASLAHRRGGWLWRAGLRVGTWIHPESIISRNTSTRANCPWQRNKEQCDRA